MHFYVNCEHLPVKCCIKCVSVTLHNSEQVLNYILIICTRKIHQCINNGAAIYLTNTAKEDMEGALPSVVAGMVDRPVIAVPTSVGYGASLGGLTALFAMLNSCSSNVAVVNIDNGFGAGYMASMINRV